MSLISTKIAIKMSRASEKTKEGGDDKAESVGSLASDDDEIDEDEEEEEAGDRAREETPDLYRNSALGMYVCCYHSAMEGFTYSVL